MNDKVFDKVFTITSQEVAVVLQCVQEVPVKLGYEAARILLNLPEIPLVTPQTTEQDDTRTE